MRTICLSDLHGYLPQVPDCDLLILAGDYCRDSRDRRWYDVDFRAWLQELRDREIDVLAVAGNHDFILRDEPKFALSLPWHYLMDESCLVFRKDEQGNPTDEPPIIVYGTPWSGTYGYWAFQGSESELEKKWATIPDGIDVLLLHGPPHGIADLTLEGDRTGSPSLLKRLREVKPSLTVCGHIHESRGTYRLTEEGEQFGWLVNASHVDRQYRPQSVPSHPELRL